MAKPAKKPGASAAAPANLPTQTSSLDTPSTPPRPAQSEAEQGDWLALLLWFIVFVGLLIVIFADLVFRMFRKG